MATYCRITGKSRGLPKPNYFPLLPPISPADAKRLCRITSKSVGQPAHHYLPVLAAKKSKNNCKNSNKLHKILPGYRYLTPCIKSNSAEKLIQILSTKTDDKNNCYVYTVRDKQCGLIFSANFEAAVRDGDIKDVMLAKDEDIILLKLKKGPDVSLEVTEINLELNKLNLYEGEGIAKIIRRKSNVTDSLRKIFEDKEIVETEEKQINSIKMKKNKKRKWNNIEEYKFNEDILKVINFNKWNWNQFNDDKFIQITNKIPNPVVIKPINVNLNEANPGVIQQPCFISDLSLELITVVAPFKPLIKEPNQELINKISTLKINDLEETLNIDILNNNIDIPTLNDLTNLTNLLKTSVKTIKEFNEKSLHGVEINLNNKKLFIVGKFIENEFIPGQTVLTSNGYKFIPGIVTKTENGIKLLPGFIIEIDGNNEFIAGQIILTNKGEKFVQGQTIITENGIKFITGQTVKYNDNIKFIPGQIFSDRFIPGQIFTTDEGLEFIPGQTVEINNKNEFIAGVSMWSEKGWEFLPGMLNKINGKFIPGRMLKSFEYTEFIPGQYVFDNDNFIFIPGITVDDNELKFICGTTIQTPNGCQFIKGQIVKISDKLQFMPGKTEIKNGESNFETAKCLEELNFEENFEETINKKELYPDGVYGQMVQSSHGVEFFPGEANSLPKGKVVSGKLIRGKDMKFIPGLMIDGNFVPGQIVITDDGEQFIPGQVIETKEGPKFIPGQIISTKTGDKFIPGQTIKTENGPKFIPGQIIETKVGPTFIPGQVIHTDDGLIKFIPGEVVDTYEGPRFVPGRVIETGDCVTFIPGQIVQTNDGLKFIAPDLINEEDNLEFTLQGFDISPEELHLLQPKGCNISIGDMIIDSHMLKQLSEAGMGIGNQVSAEIPEVSVRSAPAMNAACLLGQKLKLDPVTTVKISQITAAIVKIGKLGEIKGNTDEIQTLNKILERVIHCKNDEEAYKLISNIIEKEFSSDIIKNIDKLHAYLVSQESPLKRFNKINLMKEILNCNLSNNEILEKLMLILDDEDELSNALKRINDVQPEIINYIIERFIESIDKFENEKNIIETLHKSIVSSVRDASEMFIVDLLKDNECLQLKSLILEAVSLAKALDMQETTVTLLNLLSNPKCTNILSTDRITLEILKKLTVMKKLAEKRPEFLTALKQLNLDPYKARTDPNLVQLAKESQALLVIPEEGTLNSSVSVPTSLLFSQNSLAMEEYLSRTKKVYRILVIIKNGIQAIIPREASHSVLTGSVPYAVLDEKGIHYFQPKHVFSALKLPKICTNWFSLYKCEYKEITTNNSTN